LPADLYSRWADRTPWYFHTLESKYGCAYVADYAMPFCGVRDMNACGERCQLLREIPSNTIRHHRGRYWIRPYLLRKIRFGSHVRMRRKGWQWARGSGGERVDPDARAHAPQRPTAARSCRVNPRRFVGRLARRRPRSQRPCGP
jgi:hypothetical protein